MMEKITVNKQSSIRIGAGKIIYFDPYKLESESHDADIIFFTHLHPDHFSPSDYQKAAKADTIFVAPKSMEKEVLEAGVEKEKLITLQPDEKCNILGIAVETVPAYNIGKPMHPKKNEWLGYVITVDDTRIYVCGDTDVTPEGKTVECDIIFVPIGGFFTMNAEEAAKLVNEIKPKIAAPIHYGGLVGKPEDVEKFKKLIHAGTQVCVVLAGK